MPSEQDGKWIESTYDAVGTGKSQNSPDRVWSYLTNLCVEHDVLCKVLIVGNDRCHERRYECISSIALQLEGFVNVRRLTICHYDILDGQELTFCIKPLAFLS